MPPESTCELSGGLRSPRLLGWPAVAIGWPRPGTAGSARGPRRSRDNAGPSPRHTMAGRLAKRRDEFPEPNGLSASPEHCPEYRDGEVSPVHHGQHGDGGTPSPACDYRHQEFRRLVRKAGEACSPGPWPTRLTRAVELVRGEFLLEFGTKTGLPTPSWVHAEIRQALLPVAIGRSRVPDHDSLFSAATAFLALDPYRRTGVYRDRRRPAESGESRST